MKQALLIIDVQNDYFKGGKMPLMHSDQALQQLLKVKDFFDKQQLPVIYIQHINAKKNADFFEKDTLGVAIHPLLLASNTGHEITIVKAHPNSFFETGLQETLIALQVDQLVITGMMTHMCVDSTTRAAKELGFQPVLIADATATKELAFGEKVVIATDVQTAFLSALQHFSTSILSSKDFLHSTK
ncbi:cysteine hydrolase family protein [Isobaculum melis]|uniref:Nicotinamidase-related amidase n=1 Tax=Isobaculum melis TaxID=142588 RepID=A0A1H9TXF4_9LACT|nr:cysteine hydrolase family protein [Isobaculum melis]SES01654.1 Nicotinamidase-related amidase [Isobaculum melis]